jgi:hypothetical protein
MASRKVNKNERRKNERHNEEVAHKQETAQTGAENNGGETRHDKDDQFTKDLKRAGDRKSRE